MDFKEALSLRGKVAFAEGQTFARLSAPLARLLARWAASSGLRPLTEEVRVALRSTCVHLRDAPPRVVGPSRVDPPILVFIDGACEATVSIGGVLIDPVGECQCFGAVLGPEVVDAWKSKTDQVQVIGQAEIFPALVARLTWALRLRNRRVIYFIDNEAARLGLIKAYSPVLASLRLIVQCLEWDFKNASSPWYARVPTACNPADGPSRMNLETVPKRLRPNVVRPIFPNGTSPLEVLM